MISPAPAQIGSGTFATVESARGMAVKRYKDRELGKPVNDITDIINEAAALVHLKGCPQVPDFLGLAHPWELTMPLHGPSLFDSPITHSEDANTLLEDLLLGIDFIHQRNVAHRDITTCNVLWKSAKGGSGFVICDFGRAISLSANAGAKRFDSRTTHRTPPEAEEGITSADGVRAVDVYCVGNVVRVQTISLPPTEGLEVTVHIVRKLMAPINTRLTAEEGLELFSELIHETGRPLAPVSEKLTDARKLALYEQGQNSLQLYGLRVRKANPGEKFKAAVRMFHCLHTTNFIRAGNENPREILGACLDLAKAVFNTNVDFVESEHTSDALRLKIMHHLAFDLYALA